MTHGNPSAGRTINDLPAEGEGQGGPAPLEGTVIGKRRRRYRADYQTLRGIAVEHARLIHAVKTGRETNQTRVEQMSRLLSRQANVVNAAEQERLLVDIHSQLEEIRSRPLLSAPHDDAPRIGNADESDEEAAS